MAAVGGGGAAGGGAIEYGDAEAMCSLCNHEHAVGTVCGQCGHNRQPAPPVFRSEGELQRQPGVFAVQVYPLTDALLRSAAGDPVSEADRSVRAAWAFERILRGRLRDELAAQQGRSAGDASPPVATNLAQPADGDPTHEVDALEVPCRHVLGRSELAGRRARARARARGVRPRLPCPSEPAHSSAPGAPLASVSPSPPLPLPPPPLRARAVGDACVSTVRWRLVQTDAVAPGEGPTNVALLDRLYVLPYYRRRRVARTTVLNCLVDIYTAQSSQGLSVHRVSVIIPNEPRLASTHALLTGLGFTVVGSSGADLTGMWAAPGGAGGGRQYLELALPFASVLPLLQAAQAAAEGVRPPA